MRNYECCIQNFSKSNCITNLYKRIIDISYSIKRKHSLRMCHLINNKLNYLHPFSAGLVLRQGTPEYNLQISPAVLLKKEGQSFKETKQMDQITRALELISCANS